ncbi:MAG: IS5 family transposase [Oscillospiraceae bacterium]|nr:IS5 family transposase [Oscillospiraceae bacterium]
MQIGIWDESLRLEKLSKLGDSLEKLNRAIDWELFRPKLTKVFKKQAKGAGGRPPYDYVMLFKALVLQRIYNLSDDQTEYQINDRMSFMRFLGLGLGDRVPDAKTIWLYRDTLTKANVIRELFDLFNAQLEDAGLITHTGTIVDATFVEAPRQHNHHNENEDIKKGNVPDAWKKPENIHKLRRKDMDARWTRKGREFHFGYKDHVKADADSKLITDYTVTPANVHDSQPMPTMINETDKAVYADSAYWGSVVAEALPQNVENCIQERGTKKQPLTEEQKASNRIKSKTRCRIEHIFGFMTNSMHGITVRSVGLARAEFNIGLTNLIYNLCRFEFLNRPVKTVG